jgi:hypothetical protein
MINFTWTVSSLQIYLMTYTQEVSTVVGMADKTVKECQGALIIILKFKWDGIHARVRGNITAMIWKDKQDVHVLLCTDHQEKVTFVTWENSKIMSC